ncbi:hypothetical protein ACRAWD_20075 [Caulobacter segnis]
MLISQAHRRRLRHQPEGGPRGQGGGRSAWPSTSTTARCCGA